jgi:hypothetical protein
MTDEQYGSACLRHIPHLPQTLLLEGGIPYRQHLIHQQNLWLQMSRDHYSDKLTKYGRRLGQLETQVKQLTAPDKTTTTNDAKDGDDDAAIDAEFSESTPSDAAEFSPV